jgi:hypothetical protein
MQLRTALAALAIAVTAAQGAAAQDGTRYRYLNRSDASIVMVRDEVTGAQTDRRVHLLLVRASGLLNGADNYTFEYSVNCTDKSYRILWTEAYAGDKLIAREDVGTGTEASTPGTLTGDTVVYACAGMLASGDKTVLTGKAAARAYAATRRMP